MFHTITFTLIDAAGNEVTHELPARFEVCGRCDGHGTHVNPSIDGDGISAAQFAEDPDFEQSYFAGHYDVPCEVCHGARVVPVVDETRCRADLLAAYDKQQREEAYYAREAAAERRWERQ